MPEIFVSYRHEDSQHLTARLVEHLRYRFGEERVFRDRESIAPRRHLAQGRRREVRRRRRPAHRVSGEAISHSAQSQGTHAGVRAWAESVHRRSAARPGGVGVDRMSGGGGGLRAVGPARASTTSRRFSPARQPRAHRVASASRHGGGHRPLRHGRPMAPDDGLRRPPRPPQPFRRGDRAPAVRHRFASPGPRLGVAHRGRENRGHHGIRHGPAHRTGDVLVSLRSEHSQGALPESLRRDAERPVWSAPTTTPTTSGNWRSDARWPDCGPKAERTSATAGRTASRRLRRTGPRLRGRPSPGRTGWPGRPSLR